MNHFDENKDRLSISTLPDGTKEYYRNDNLERISYPDGKNVYYKDWAVYKETYEKAISDKNWWLTD